MLIGAHYEGPLAAVRARMAAAAELAGRNPQSVTLIAVSKGHPPEAIRAVRALGVVDFGENYVQEALLKMDILGQAPQPLPSTHWHFIGQLQSNKTRAIAEHFAWVHGLDRASVARRLDAQRPPHIPPLNVCLQVRLAHEPAKGGLEPSDLAAAAQELVGLPRLKLRGLMCLPPPTDNVDRQRSWFRQVRELLEELNRQGYGLDSLSMGMSGDFEAAITEGATHVRIGTAIFGPRGH